MLVARPVLVEPVHCECRFAGGAGSLGVPVRWGCRFAGGAGAMAVIAN
jgi:hypothetical protein